MIIDYHMLSELLTPSFFRKARWMAFIRTLYIRQIQRLHTAWLVWSIDSRYRASVTPQVISLEHMAERNLDCRIRIDELDGKPYDFLVNVEGNPDMAKLTRLLNTYKLAGKSYVYEMVGPVGYSCFFFNHVLEDIEEKYACEFINHVAEDERTVKIWVYLFADSNQNQWNVIARASKAVKSDITVSGTVQKKTDGYITLVDTFHVFIETDTTEGEAPVSITDSITGGLFLETRTILPNKDDYYDYEIENFNKMNYGTDRI